jgi:hypothetical protein
LEPLEEASQFIRHLARIDRYRVYTPQPLCTAVRKELRGLWEAPATSPTVV